MLALAVAVLGFSGSRVLADCDVLSIPNSQFPTPNRVQFPTPDPVQFPTPDRVERSHSEPVLWELEVGGWELTASQVHGFAPDETLRRIGALLDANDLAGARAAVASALEQYPSDPALHNFAGAVAAQSDDVKTAEGEFQTAIRLAPDQPAPYENLGRLYQEHAATIAGASGKALDVYRQLLRIVPDNAEALYQSGFLLALDGRFADSRALIDRLPAGIRGQPQALAVSALDLAALGESKAAEAAVRALASHPDFSAADVAAVQPALDHLADHAVETGMLEALDRRGLATPRSLTRLGQLALAGGDAAAAHALFERAAAGTPGGAGVPLLIELARSADKTGDHKGALGYLAHARAIEPGNATVHFLFGIVCVELDLVREAYDSLQKAVALMPDNPNVNYAMGAVSMHGHEPADALPYFEKYVALRPDDPRGHLALGVARFYANQFAPARTALADAAGHPQTAATAHYFLGRIARQFNDLATAYREVSESVRLNPGYADAWAELGLVETRRGNYKAAEAAIDKAVAVAPDNLAAAVNLATLYARTKDPRREAQAARVTALQKERNEKAQEFLRIIKVEP